ncbi:MAG: hypothetical protein JSV80_10430, partial [Acidobacteriota bacterium]
ASLRRGAPLGTWSARVAEQALSFALANRVDRGRERPSLAELDRRARRNAVAQRAAWQAVRPLAAGLVLGGWPVHARADVATESGARMLGAWLGGRVADAIESERVGPRELRRWLLRPRQSETEARRLLVEIGRHAFGR